MVGSGNWAVIVEDKGHRTKFKYELRLGAPASRVAQTLWVSLF
jgi:hypothetical protein